MSAGLGRVRLGPVRLHGSVLVLRPPRFADYAQWRRLRLRDRALIEPFWHSSPLDWHRRHTEKYWVRECLEAATNARAGRRLATVIEIDGRFAGQVEIGSIDPVARQGEMGIWIDAEMARHGFGGLAAAMILDFGFDVLGLERIIAPISPENTAAAHGAAQIGYRCEARMAMHFHVGGKRSDHDLWAMTRAEIPPKGFTDTWIERVLERRSAVLPAVLPTVDRTPRAATVLVVSARYRVAQAWRRIERLIPARPLSLPLPERPGAVLRSPRPGDIVHGWRRRRNVGAGASGGGWREFARSTTGLRSAQGLLLVVDVDGRAVGRARLFDIDLFDGNARIHIRLDPAHTDDDVRLAATRALLNHAFDGAGLYRVTTEIESGDTATAAVAARAGLHKEGVMRGYIGPGGRRADHELWAITASGSEHA
ncbi:GNAT family N-acetyltransferase [Nocardia inohanensis]|uniref:GNAT family N-acetyltransferase n=1 Tax=Nocardia inohanensis TaxID=209246 RepID=UPI00082C7BC1|nr:GNAT family protein [Nocardia inohanensis]